MRRPPVSPRERLLAAGLTCWPGPSMVLPSMGILLGFELLTVQFSWLARDLDPQSLSALYSFVYYGHASLLARLLTPILLLTTIGPLGWRALVIRRSSDLLTLILVVAALACDQAGSAAHEAMLTSGLAYAQLVPLARTALPTVLGATVLLATAFLWELLNQRMRHRVLPPGVAA